MNKSLLVGYIYGLKHPLSKYPSYVGQTKHNVKQRLYDHIKFAKKGKKTILYNWVRNLLDDKTKPIIEILEEVHSPNTLNEREKYWVTYFNSKKQLVNTLLIESDINASEYSVNFIPRKTEDRIDQIKNEIKDLMYKGVSIDIIKELYIGKNKDGFRKPNILKYIIKDILKELTKSSTYKSEWDQFHDSVKQALCNMLKSPSNKRWFNRWCPGLIEQGNIYYQDIPISSPINMYTPSPIEIPIRTFESLVELLNH